MSNKTKTIVKVTYDSYSEFSVLNVPMPESVKFYDEFQNYTPVNLADCRSEIELNSTKTKNSLSFFQKLKLKLKGN